MKKTSRCRHEFVTKICFPRYDFIMSETKPKPSKAILMVTADSQDREMLRAEFESSDLDFFEADSTLGAERFLADRMPDLILCEVELCDGSGYSLIRRLRDDPDVSPKPMLMLLSRWSNEADKILGFECGADDFVTIPFFARELASRVRALLRRRLQMVERECGDASVFKRGGISIDADQRTVWLNGKPIRLTQREISILAALGRSEGRVLSRSDLLAQTTRPGEKVSERSIDAHIKGLRHKLGEAQRCIETVHGRGYRYSPDAVPISSSDPG